MYITSERVIDTELEQYRISVNPVDIHHLMAFSSLFIGDSQTMAAEAAVLGVPFIRFNDFVGKISYLNELENHYNLGYGIDTHNLDQLFKKVQELLIKNDKKKFFKIKKDKMLSEKIDYALFICELLDHYSKSSKIAIKSNP